MPTASSRNMATLASRWLRIRLASMGGRGSTRPRFHFQVGHLRAGDRSATLRSPRRSLITPRDRGGSRLAMADWMDRISELRARARALEERLADPAVAKQPAEL